MKSWGRCDNCRLEGEVHEVRVPFGWDNNEREAIRLCDDCDGPEAA